MIEISVLPGTDKQGVGERFGRIDLRAGELYAIVGNTGSGKTRFIKDVEQIVCGDSPTGRTVLINGRSPERSERRACAGRLVAHLSQSMRFVLDTTVEDFIERHRVCRESPVSVERVIELANLITPERISPGGDLNLLSGGQTRALMIADVALVCDSPVVLVDEIENAGIDKEIALEALLDARKLVLIVTHDPHTALMAHTRIVMEGGAVCCLRERSKAEEALAAELHSTYQRTKALQYALRTGKELT